MILRKEKIYYITENQKISNPYFYEQFRESTLKTKKTATKDGMIFEEPLIRVKGIIYCSKEYKDIVIDLIRNKYCINDEIAIIRQKDTKTDEFNEYNEYVENCKKTAKEFVKERKMFLGK